MNSAAYLTFNYDRDALFSAGCQRLSASVLVAPLPYCLANRLSQEDYVWTSNCRWKPFVIALLLLAPLLLISTSCRRSEALGAVRIGTMGDAVDYAPYMVARSKGWFEEEFRKNGATGAEYTSFQSLPNLNETLATNRLDLVFEAEPPAIVGKGSAGVDLRIIGISCSLTQDILVRADSPIQTVADLRGKKATVPIGTSSHYNLLAILAAAAVPESDVQIIDMSPPDARNAFETGRVDAWAIWPPWVEEQVVSGKGRVLPGTNARIHSIMSVRGKFEEEHKPIVTAAFEVLERSKAWIREHPDEARGIVAQSLKLDRKIIDLAWPKHDWSAELNKAVIDDIQAKADFLYKRGLIKSPMNVSTQLIFPMQKSQ
jgi:sulfonate transport system substrate-binding protein